MIRQTIVLEKYGGWVIHAYYATSEYDVDEIMESLWRIGIDSHNARRAFENLSSGEINTGLCFSNFSMRESVLVVALTSSPAEALNSLTHEASHAGVHIATALGINHKTEDFAYLIGELCREMYSHTKRLFCDCCNRK